MKRSLWNQSVHGRAEATSTRYVSGRDMIERSKLDREIMKMERMAVLGKLAAVVNHEIYNSRGQSWPGGIGHGRLSGKRRSRPKLRLYTAMESASCQTTRLLLDTVLPNSVQYDTQNLA